LLKKRWRKVYLYGAFFECSDRGIFLYVQINFVKIVARFEDKGIIMRQATVVGNWKMHGSIESVDTLLQQLVESLNELQQIKIAVCPPFVLAVRAGRVS
jgi:hypothetical protein